MQHGSRAYLRGAFIVMMCRSLTPTHTFEDGSMPAENAPFGKFGKFYTQTIAPPFSSRPLGQYGFSAALFPLRGGHTARVCMRCGSQ